MKRQSRARPVRIGTALGSDLMLAPMVIFMRLPLMAAEAGNAGRWATESALAISEKAAALAEGAFAAQMSMHGLCRALLAGNPVGPHALDPQRGAPSRSR